MIKLAKRKKNEIRITEEVLIDISEEEREFYRQQATRIYANAALRLAQKKMRNAS